MQNRIFSVDSPKAIKARAYGYLNAIHYMAPASLSGVNLCPHASAGCIALCLGWTSGQAGMVKTDDQMNSVRLSRIAKAKRFMSDRQDYMNDVFLSIQKAQDQADKLGLKLCVRLNGSTDIAWEGIKVPRTDRNLMEWFPDVQFVDYTKNYRRMLQFCGGKLPRNYHLTFSRSEVNEHECRVILDNGGTVAAVFAGDKPSSYLGRTVVDGDKHDLIHTVKPCHVIALSPKGRKARADTSGFVVR